MKREENEQMKTNILEAVIACKIAASGADVALSQIASRANISERTLNRYFPDKEMLFYTASISYLRGVYDKCAARYLAMDKAGLSGLQCLLLIVQMQIEHNKSNLDCAKIFVRAYTTALRTAVYRNLPVAGYDEPIRKIVIGCIEDGIRDGSIRKDVVPLDTYLLVSSNFMGLIQRLIYFYSVDVSEEEHKKELLLVFNKYLQMLEIYLKAN